jgi:hypothetical protein
MVEARKLAVELAKKHLEQYLRAVLDTYAASATGETCGGKRRKYDSANLRHFVDRFVGPAPRTLNLDMQDTVESFFEHVMDEEEGKSDGHKAGRKRGELPPSLCSKK